MTSAELLTWCVLGGGVIVLAIQYGIFLGQQKNERRIEAQRGSEIKVLLEYVRMAWRQR